MKNPHRSNDMLRVEPIRLYNSRYKNNEKKYDHLQALALSVPSIYHQYYKDLPHEAEKKLMKIILIRKL